MVTILQTGKSIYDIEQMMLDLSKEYFKNEDGTDLDIAKIRAGLYGWLSATQANLAFNNILTKSNLYDEHFLNTARLSSSVYNKAKIHGYDVNLATPATMEVVIGLKVSDILEVANITGSPFIISNNDKFSAGGYDYSLMYDIEVTYNKNYGDFSKSTISAVYNMEDANLDIGIYDISSPYLSSYVLEDEQMFFVKASLFQVTRKEHEFIYNSDDTFKNISFDLSFTKQLAGFNVYYKEDASADAVKLTAYYGVLGDPNISYEKFCNYDYPDSTSLKISFFNNTTNFTPNDESIISVELFETDGARANFTFSGNLTANFNDPNYYKYTIYSKAITPSTNGSDRPTDNDIKIGLLNYIQSKGEIITENDINNYLSKIEKTYDSSNSEFKLIKYRDDFTKRSYDALVLLKDSNNKTVPTNTINLKIGKKFIDDDAFDYFKKSSDSSLINVPSGTFIVYKRYVNNNNNVFFTYSDYKIMTHSDHNLFSESSLIKGALSWLEYYMVNESSYRIYKTVYDIIIDKNKFLRAYYNKSSVNEKYKLNISQMNQVFNKTFLISDVSIRRNSISSSAASNIYEFNFDISSNIDKKYVNINAAGVDKNQLHAVILFYSKDGDDRTYHGFKNCKLDINEEIKDPYSFYANVESVNRTEKYGTSVLKLFPIDPDTGDVTASIIQEIEVPNSVRVSILLSYDPGANLNSFFPQTMENPLNYAIDLANPDIYDVIEDGLPTMTGLIDVINVLEVETTTDIVLNDSMTDVMQSDITYTGFEYGIKNVPVVEHRYIDVIANFDFFIQTLTNYEKMFNSILGVIRQGTTVNMKFYNSYGISKLFSVGETFVDIKLTIHLRGEINNQLKLTMKNHIVAFINNINTDEVNKFSFSNLTTSLENTFPEISSVILRELNGAKVYNIVESSDYVEVPEYLNIVFDEETDGYDVDIEFINH